MDIKELIEFLSNSDDPKTRLNKLKHELQQRALKSLTAEAYYPLQSESKINNKENKPTEVVVKISETVQPGRFQKLKSFFSKQLENMKDSNNLESSDGKNQV